MRRIATLSRPGARPVRAVSQAFVHTSATSIPSETQQPNPRLKVEPNTLAPREGESTEKPQKKTIAELDEELRLKLEGISGDGGAAGVEYENGKAEGLKRNVKANMFRVI